ncbi:MAG: hypothetical protein ACI9HH_001623, partial [Pseudomonadota bacterium]
MPSFHGLIDKQMQSHCIGCRRPARFATTGGWI